ncbi:hypothetical protein IGI04_014694 [Brassica rapa subsp. trilocularis]|uniref:Uncharacterized protein n=1 Tax=Brassica rapa subsp. trilocularis TaxID=1813537 RepID=A0ABQ7MN03_BRACM|nr:hypothetical protein IGI04_014694 [Brassica rapa subsp. trilocularis]
MAQRDLRRNSKPTCDFLNQKPICHITVYAWFVRKDKCHVSADKSEVSEDNHEDWENGISPLLSYDDLRAEGKKWFSYFPNLNGNRWCEFRFPQALKDINKNQKKSTSTRAPVVEPSLFISKKSKDSLPTFVEYDEEPIESLMICEKNCDLLSLESDFMNDDEQAIVELIVLQPEHPSNLEEPLDYPHQRPRLDTRKPLDDDPDPIFDEEQKSGPVFAEEATSIISIIMKSYLCFDPDTTPAPLSSELQEHFSISKRDSGPRKKRHEPKPIIGFRIDLSAFKKDRNQEKWPWNYEVMIHPPKPAILKTAQPSSISQETGGTSKPSNFICADESIECPSRNQVTIDVPMEFECFLSFFHFDELKENPKEAAKCSPHGKPLELVILNEPKMIPQLTSCPNQKHCKDHGLIVSAHHENFPRRASTGERLRTCVHGTWNRTYLRETNSNFQGSLCPNFSFTEFSMNFKSFISDLFPFDTSTMDLRTNPFEEGRNDVPQSTDQYMKPAQHEVQEVLNISTEVHVFHRTGQTDRPVPSRIRPERCFGWNHGRMTPYQNLPFPSNFIF